MYAECCELLHKGSYPSNALSLMRSRYSAYALQNPSYIMRTTDSDNSHWQADQGKWGKEIMRFCLTTEFVKLEIIDFTNGEESATVTFIAHLRQANHPMLLKEKSFFVKKGPQWLYQSGVMAE